MEGIHARWNVWKLDIAEKYAPAIGRLKGIDNSLDDLEKSGFIDKIATSIGTMATTILMQLNMLIPHLDTFVEKIADSKFYSIIFPTIISLIKNAIAFVF